ncbi:MAG: O-antigen ligase family protein [Pseudomonadota bacterium]
MPLTPDTHSIYSRRIGIPADAAARWVAIALGAAIPISTALDNILLLLLLLCGALGYGFNLLRIVQVNPVARAGWILGGLFALGVGYGAAPLNEAMGMFGKYADLLLLPFFMRAMRNPDTRSAAVNAFLGAMLATLLLSTLVGLGLLKPASWMWGGVDNPAIFRSSITQNLFMAYAVLLALLRAQQAGRYKWLWLSGAALGAVNILFLVKGRTGYVVLFLLSGYWVWVSWSAWLARHGHRASRWHAGGIIVLCLVAIAAVYQFSPRFHQRVTEVVDEYRAWDPGVPSQTSTGQRLEFYYHSLRLAGTHWLLGAGTGGFARTYAEAVRGSDIPPTHNPHNEYLHFAVQWGIPGLALLLYLFYCQWRLAPRLATATETHLARGLVLAVAAGCLFNSLLMDHAEGLFYAWMSGALYAGLRERAA